ncbi:Fanconi anemia core complex-associated protein 20 [Camelus dromedarius]|uniref:Fanconi anemia core complex-associated protein 20 n=1 Tax=Camelus dromedarius TaxID=9838 RepID=A0A5N4DAG4_CAMDR|nr:Fanconi anemia core complex-associated protein 20 [Camelus dromedarius]
MESARRPRLSLSRRRPPSGVGPPSAAPGSHPDGGECARLWDELFRVASADLNVHGELPPLPAFPRQEPMRSPEQAPPESFTVGTKTFSWTPFPPVPERGRGRVRSCPVSPQHHPVREPRGTPSAEEQPSLEGTPTLRSCPMCQADFSPGKTLAFSDAQELFDQRQMPSEQRERWRWSAGGASSLDASGGAVGLAPLDIDSHLAQCLADSTDDVVW